MAIGGVVDTALLPAWKPHEKMAKNQYLRHGWTPHMKVRLHPGVSKRISVQILVLSVINIL